MIFLALGIAAFIAWILKDEKKIVIPNCPTGQYVVLKKDFEFGCRFPDRHENENAQCRNHDGKPVEFRAYFEEKTGIYSALNNGIWDHVYGEDIATGSARMADAIATFQDCLNKPPITQVNP